MYNPCTAYHLCSSGPPSSHKTNAEEDPTQTEEMCVDPEIAEHFQCIVCYETSRIVALPCQHFVCTVCATTLGNRAAATEEAGISCPACRMVCSFGRLERLSVFRPAMVLCNPEACGSAGGPAKSPARIKLLKARDWQRDGTNDGALRKRMTAMIACILSEFRERRTGRSGCEDRTVVALANRVDAALYEAAVSRSAYRDVYDLGERTNEAVVRFLHASRAVRAAT